MTKGIIAGGSEQTVSAGAEMLRRGGNAVDAAVAAAFASFVGEPILSTPSGGGFATVFVPGQAPVVYDFFCTTPGLGEDRRGAGIDFVPVTVQYESGTSVYHIGRASSAVPGNVPGLAQLLADAGTLPLDVVLEPAIRLAREGYILSEKQADLIQLVDVILAYDPRCGTVFAPQGRFVRAGERFRNTALAATLEQVARDGWETFTTGAVAEAMVADQAAHGGLITADDLASYQVVRREPLRFDYGNTTIYTNPPPSAGGILIAYMLALFAGIDRAGMAHNSADHAALVAEIMRQVALARVRDRPAKLPDPAAWDGWLNGPRLAQDRAAIAAALASGTARRGWPEHNGPASTTHISVMDENGLAVGLTTTPGETAGYMVGDTGILANNILGEEELSPDGFLVWEPGMRLASMMAPTITADADGARLVMGSGGAARLRSAIFHLLSNVLDWGMGLAAAVDAPRVHLEGDVLDLEGGFSPAEADQLEARGYVVSRWPGRAFYFGGTHAVQREPSGRLTGAGDARRGGAVAIVD
ncbi:MAG: gamma-glutamyltransferase [Anaerolineae bacterium]